MQFRFFSSGMAPQSRKHYLSKTAQTLPHIFVKSDIKPGMFSPSVEKRLFQAKKHGTKIVLRRWRGAMVGVVVVNKEDHQAEMKKRNAQIKSVKSSLKASMYWHGDEIKSYLKMLKKLSDLVDADLYPRRELQL